MHLVFVFILSSPLFACLSYKHIFVIFFFFLYFILPKQNKHNLFFFLHYCPIYLYIFIHHTYIYVCAIFLFFIFFLCTPILGDPEIYTGRVSINLFLICNLILLIIIFKFKKLNVHNIMIYGTIKQRVVLYYQITSPSIVIKIRLLITP